MMRAPSKPNLLHWLARISLSLFATLLTLTPLSRSLSYAEDAAPTEVNKVATIRQFKDNLPKPRESELDLDGFLNLTRREPVVVLDVRSKEQFSARHLKKSVNLPLTELTEHTLPAVAPDKNVPIVLVCDDSFSPKRMFSMTLQAYPVLKANGYSTIYRLSLWSNKGQSVSPEEQEQVLEFEGGH